MTRVTELLREQNNAGLEKQLKENSSNEPLFKITPMNGTPFVIHEQEGDFNILFGQYKINKTELKSKEACQDYLENNQWDVIAQITGIITYLINNTNTNATTT